jgi:hypothetical protein
MVPTPVTWLRPLPASELRRDGREFVVDTVRETVEEWRDASSR